jgi:hypothetical protein
MRGFVPCNARAQGKAHCVCTAVFLEWRTVFSRYYKEFPDGTS